MKLALSCEPGSINVPWFRAAKSSAILLNLRYVLASLGCT
jgi:hypothetical protein